MFHHLRLESLILFSTLSTFFLQAEEINIKNRVYHKKCLSCKNCKRPIDVALMAIGKYDTRFYCFILGA